MSHGIRSLYNEQFCSTVSTQTFIVQQRVTKNHWLSFAILWIVNRTSISGSAVIEAHLWWWERFEDIIY